MQYKVLYFFNQLVSTFRLWPAITEEMAEIYFIWTGYKLR